MTYYNPFTHQEEAIQAIFDYFNNGNKGNPLIVAPGGAGKTVTFAEENMNGMFKEMIFGKRNNSKVKTATKFGSMLTPSEIKEIAL